MYEVLQCERTRSRVVLSSVGRANCGGCQKRLVTAVHSTFFDFWSRNWFRAFPFPYIVDIYIYCLREAVNWLDWEKSVLVVVRHSCSISAHTAGQTPPHCWISAKTRIDRLPRWETSDSRVRSPPQTWQSEHRDPRPLHLPVYSNQMPWWKR